MVALEETLSITTGDTTTEITMAADNTRDQDKNDRVIFTMTMSEEFVERRSSKIFEIKAEAIREVNKT